MNATFLNCSGFLSIGIKKYKYANPLNAKILLIPTRNVLSAPNPKIGKILCGIKSFTVAKRIISILIKRSGINIKFT